MTKDIDMQAYADRFRKCYRINYRINNAEQDVKSLVSKLVNLAEKNYTLLDDELELIANYKLAVLEETYTGISKLSFIYLYVYKNPSKSITQLRNKLIDKELYEQCWYDDAKYRKQLKLKLEKEIRQRDRLNSFDKLRRTKEELSQAYESIKSIDEDTERNKARYEKLKLRQLELDNIQIKLDDRQRQKQRRIAAKHAGLRSYRPFKSVLDSGENGTGEHIDDIINIMNECKALGVAYLADAYIRNNPTKTLEEIEETLLNKELIEYAFKSKHKYRTLLKFKLQKRLIDNTEIFNRYKLKDAAKMTTNNSIKQESFTSKCRRLGVIYGQYKYYERLHPEMTTEQIDEYFRERLLNGKDTFKAQCERAGVSYDTACQYRARHSEISQEDTINYFVNKRNNKLLEQQALQRCKELKIPMKLFNSTRVDNPTLTYNEIIKICFETLSKRPKTFKAKCEEAGINYSNARYYKVYHPDLTDEQIIEYYLHREE